MRTIILLLLLSCSGSNAEHYTWINRYTGGNSTGRAIGLDSAGNIYVAGIFEQTLIVGSNLVQTTGTNDIFLMKLSPAGELLWFTTAGGPFDDAVHRIVIADQNVVFLCGAFTRRSRFGASEVRSATTAGFVARVDNGRFTWAKPIFEDAHTGARGIAMSPVDQTVCVIGFTGRLSITAFTRDGFQVENAFPELPTAHSIFPTAIAIARDGTVFVTGSSGGQQFAMALDRDGRELWMRVIAERSTYGTSIALLSDGSVITGGTVLRSAGGAGYFHASLARFTAGGELLWLRAAGEHRGHFEFSDVAVDSRDNIYACGLSAEYYLSQESRMGALTAIYDRDGNVLHEERIRSHRRGDDNFALGIAVDPDSSTYFTGWVKGTAVFGTNEIGGALGVANSFVARRPTVTPLLTIMQSGTNLVVSWPITALPFVLQESAGSDTQNWSSVIAPVQNMNGRNQAIISRDPPRSFRLMRTNEIPIDHEPRVYVTEPAPRFLDREAVIIVGGQSNAVSVRLSCTALDYDSWAKFRFSWMNAVDANVFRSVERSVVFDWRSAAGRSYYYAEDKTDPTIYTPGEYTIHCIVSDDAFIFTNRISFEVILVETAIERLIAQIKANEKTRQAGQNTGTTCQLL